jgi:hypothetical protein
MVARARPNRVSVRRLQQKMQTRRNPSLPGICRYSRPEKSSQNSSSLYPLQSPKNRLTAQPAFHPCKPRVRSGVSPRPLPLQSTPPCWRRGIGERWLEPNHAIGLKMLQREYQFFVWSWRVHCWKTVFQVGDQPFVRTSSRFSTRLAAIVHAASSAACSGVVV